MAKGIEQVVEGKPDSFHSNRVPVQVVGSLGRGWVVVVADMVEAADRSYSRVVVVISMVAAGLGLV